MALYIKSMIPKTDLFNQCVWSDGEFVVMASYFEMFPVYRVYERRTMTEIGSTNFNYYMGQVRQIINHYKKLYESRKTICGR